MAVVGESSLPSGLGAALHNTGHSSQTGHRVSTALGLEGSSEEAEGRLELLVSTEV